MASSRRGASDINILAMLDGLGSRPHAKRTMLWYGAGGLLACVLIGMLVWLAHEPGAHLDSTMVSGLPPAPNVAAAAGTPPMPIEHIAETLPAAAAPPAPAPAGGATIVNVADEPAPPALAAEPEPEPAAAPLHILPAPRAAAVRTAAPRSLAVHAPPARGAFRRARAGAARASTRRGAPLVKPVPAPAAVDTDVALISAIIQHAATQPEAAGDAACTGKGCGPRMPAQP